MNFAYGVIAIVGVLAAIILGFIAVAPDDIIQPRASSVVEKVTVCTMQWEPMCGIDGETYGNLCMLNASDVKLDYEGECVVAEPEPEAVEEETMEEETMIEDEVMTEKTMMEDGTGKLMEAETMMEDGTGKLAGDETMMEETMEEETMMEETMEEEMMIEEEIEEPEAETLPMTLAISIPQGSGALGCEETDECYFPYSIEVKVGDTVKMTNTDSSGIHTFTAGTVDGYVPTPSGVFDSGILNVGDSFEYTADMEGEIPYYCMLHTWMAGIIDVS